MATIYNKKGDILSVTSDTITKLAYENYKKGKIIRFKPEILKDISIYKFMPLEYCLSMLKSRSLLIGRVAEWPDPYENHFFKEHLFSPKLNMAIGIDHMIPSSFGQCWSLTEESDALWRIYSYDCKSVRIKTTLQKLFDVVYIDDDCMTDTWIGKVDYMDEKDIHINNQNNCDNYAINEAMAYSMFLKRKEFIHENEARIIKILDSEHTEKFKNIKFLSYMIEPCSFIDEICFDPRADENFYNSSAKLIKEKYCFTGAVNKSTLYDFHPTMINYNH